MKRSPFLFSVVFISCFFFSSFRSSGQDYTVYTAKLYNIFSVCFQDNYTWYALGQYNGAVREDMRDGSLRFYDMDDGIPDKTVNTIFADSDGMLWFGTKKGVSRWDGSSWAHYSFDSPFEALETLDIREDESGVLWFATWNGIRSFDGTKWTVWKEELPGITRHIAIGHNGIKWFGTERGLIRFDGNEWSQYGPSEYVCAVFEDSKERVWVLYYDDRQDFPSRGHLAVISNGVMNDAQIQIAFTLNRMGAIGETPDGAIWCGAGRQFHVYDGLNWTTVPLGGDRTYQTITCASLAPDGSLWFGGYFNERYLIKNGLLTYKPLETGPVWNEMLSAVVDSRGIKWFGANRGLSRFDGVHWKTYYDRDGLAGNRVNALAAAGDILWCGTNRGISRYDGKSWKTFGVADGLPDSSITCLSASQSTVWAGSAKGVSRFDGESWKTFTTADGLPGDQVNALFQDDRSGIIYAGTNQGAATFNGNSWISISDVQDSVTAILMDSSRRLWFGTNRGLLCFEGNSQAVFHQDDAVSNLPGDVITALAEDSLGAIWVATEKGSVRFNGSSWTVDFRLNKVNAIAPDKEGLTWFARNGVNMDGAVIGHSASSGTTGPLKGTWTLWSNRYGANSFAFAGDTVWTAPSGWNGVVRVDPGSHSVRSFTDEDGLAYNGVSGVASADNHTVWAVAYSGGDDKSWIMRYDGAVWSIFWESQGKLDRIAADAKGGVWAVLNTTHTNHGTVMRWDEQTAKIALSVYDIGCQTISISPRNRALLSARSFYCVPDSLWNSFSDYSDLIRIETPYTGKISSVVEDRSGILWCGGKDNPFGVARFDGESWITYTTADGLPTDVINALAVDNTGAVWAATPAGAARFDGNKWLSLTPNNSGIMSEAVTAVAVAPDGEIWFGSWDWIASFAYDSETAADDVSSQPAPLRIGNVSPNPFNASTIIRFSLPSDASALLAVYDITGRKVRDLVSGRLAAGDHAVSWNGYDDFGLRVSSGVYFARLAADNRVATRKMLFLK